MKRLYLIVFVIFQASLLFAVNNVHISKAELERIEAELTVLSQDSLRLKAMEKMVLTKQETPDFFKYIKEMFREAQIQNNPKYLCSSSYFLVIYYYNIDNPDSVCKWVNYLKPLAESLRNWHVYFNAQKTLINTYIYKRQYEYAINEAQKMLDKADALNNMNGKVAAYQCLINAYHETSRKNEEFSTLLKVYCLFPSIKDRLDKVDILCQFIEYFRNIDKCRKLKKYIDEALLLIRSIVKEHPEMKNAYLSLSLYLETAYSDYYTAIGKMDSAKMSINQARHYVTSQSYPAYLAMLQGSSARIYHAEKDYDATLVSIDSALYNWRKSDSEQMSYAKQLSYKADVLFEMGKYKEALHYYERSNHIQDSIIHVISSVQMDEIKSMHHYDRLLLEKGKIRDRMQTMILLTVGLALLISVLYMRRIDKVRKALKMAKDETLRATQKAEEANDLKTHFLANMSHAIRVPLNGVVGFCQLLASDADIDPATQKEYSDIIQRNTEKLMRLVNNVLDLSRLEAGMMKFQIVEYDTVQLCNDAIGAVVMQNSYLKVNFVSSLTQYVVRMDFNLMMKLIVSVLSNPFQDDLEEKSVTFTLDRTGEILCFKIVNSWLADATSDNQETTMQNDINTLFLKHFGGTYQMINEPNSFPTVIFTYPAHFLE